MDILWIIVNINKKDELFPNLTKKKYKYFYRIQTCYFWQLGLGRKFFGILSELFWEKLGFWSSERLLINFWPNFAKNSIFRWIFWSKFQFFDQFRSKFPINFWSKFPIKFSINFHQNFNVSVNFSHQNFRSIFRSKFPIKFPINFDQNFNFWPNFDKISIFHSIFRLKFKF